MNKINLTKANSNVKWPYVTHHTSLLPVLHQVLI